MSEPATAGQVAIVGMAVLLPGARDLRSYWRNVCDGVDAITDLPAGRWDERCYATDAGGGPPRPDRIYCRRGGFVDDLVDVDVTRFGIAPSSVAGTEPDQLIALQVAADAVADAGGEECLPSDRTRVGVILGRGGYLTPGVARLDQRVRTVNQLVLTLGELVADLDPATRDRIRSAFTAQLGPCEPESAIGLVPNLAASRLANRLDLHGPAYTVDAACASSLIAVDTAVAELVRGRCDTMLAGGVHHCHDITLWSVFAQLGALSRSQRIRPLDRRADGLLIGEGTGVVVLKRLADAVAAGDRIYAVIRGTGVASDGRGTSLMSPASAGQVRAVRQAWRAAGLDPRAAGALGLLEAHGTATPAGDAAELATLAEVFGPPAEGEVPAVIGSVKSMIGHAMPAAGVAGLIKAALAVYHATLPPTLHCADPHPALAKTRFAPIDTVRPWEASARSGEGLARSGEGPDGPPVRRAGVNAFGFGGINAHVLIEQAPGGPVGAGSAPPRRRVSVREPERVLRLAAPSPARLAELLDVDDAALLHGDCQAGPGAGPTGLGPTGLGPTGLGPTGLGPTRLSIAGPTPKRLALARTAVARQRSWPGRGDVWFSVAPLLGSGGGKLAFVFPGLEAEFAPRVADVAEYFGLPGLAGLPGLTGLPGLASFSDSPADSPGESLVGHVGRHGVAVVRLGQLLHDALGRMNITPDAIAGHSVGEWTGLVGAGFVPAAEVDRFLETFDPDALQVPGLAFAVLGAPAQRVTDVLGEYPDVVLSHDNAPNQSIVCGPAGPVDELVGMFRRLGVLGQVLPFRSGFHTPMLAPYLDPIRTAASRFTLRAPRVPMWSATTAAPYPQDEDAVRELIIRHLLAPVRFRPMIEAMHADGCTVFVQLGYGQLGSLISDTLRGTDHLVVTASSNHHQGLAQLRRVAAALWTVGLESADPVSADTGSADQGSADQGSAAPGPVALRAARPAIRLDLGAGLVSLPEDQRRQLAERPGAVAGTPGPDVPADLTAGLTNRGALAGLAAELTEVLRDTADAAAAVLATQQNGATQQDGATRSATGEFTGVLRVSTDTMPYLRDHCFINQPPGWPDEGDRYPVVPGTTLIAQLCDVAERMTPGATTVVVRDVALHRWLAVSPPVDVTVSATPVRPGVLAMSVGHYATATVELAKGYPGPSPAVWSFDPAEESVPTMTAAELYRERWMFHGPAFQGVTELTAIGPSHVRGVLTTPPAPGGLLDSVGQLLGYWIMATRRRRTVVFPVGIRAIRFFGPSPALGATLACAIRITSLNDTTLEADLQLVASGQVWAEITGWTDRRFDSDPVTMPVVRAAQRSTLSRRQPGGWELVFERWPGLASRELMLRSQTGAAERADYQRCPPQARRHWLLGRIAMKDAVRRWLWDRGAGPIFPAEIGVCQDAAGRLLVCGMHGRTLPALSVSLAHSAEAGVAIVRPRGERAGVGTDTVGHGADAVGIDIEVVGERVDRARLIAMNAAEQELLDGLVTRSGEPETVWFTRFWTAKAAVAKAAVAKAAVAREEVAGGSEVAGPVVAGDGGTDLAHRLREFSVRSAGRDELVVTGPDGAYQVQVSLVGNPPELPARNYVVAWTVHGE